MYNFGAWVTKEIIIAESDAEAVFDAITTDYIMDYIISQAMIIPAEGEVTID